MAVWRTYDDICTFMFTVKTTKNCGFRDAILNLHKTPALGSILPGIKFVGQHNYEKNWCFSFLRCFTEKSVFFFNLVVVPCIKGTI